MVVIVEMEAQDGTKALAAIVFTDAVGYTALAADNEALALKLLERDFAQMKELAASYEGRVLKTTGDGLMILFASASQAVQCAIGIQRRLIDDDPGGPGRRLRHRLGVHVGDVVLHDGDAMGNGVNVAARLQQEAPPGRIWISQAVYEIVKQSLTVGALMVGERALRNMSEPVTIYELELDRSPAVRPSRKRTSRIWTLGVGVIVATLGVLGAIAIANRDVSSTSTPSSDVNRPVPPEPEAEGSIPVPTTPDPSTPASSTDAPAEQPPTAPAAEAPSPTGPSSPPETRPPASGGPPGAEHAALIETTRRELAGAYRFSDLSAWLKQNRPAFGEQADALIARYDSLAGFWDWFTGALARTSESRPAHLGLADFRGTFYQGRPGTVTFRAGSQLATMEVSKIPPQRVPPMSLAMSSLLRLTPGERARALAQLELFADEFKLPGAKRGPRPRGPGATRG